MVNKPISVGDLVVVVRGVRCCGAGLDSLGIIFRVTRFLPYSSRCKYCGQEREGVVADSAMPFYFYDYRLKRIPPLGELEGERTEENIREPA
jgi:hypothetical protein